MKKELAVSGSTELAAVNMNEWGDVIVEAKDLILPRILLQQAMSESVKQRTAMSGDYVNSLQGSVCSDKDGLVKVLPFYCRQSYTVEKFNGKKFEFHKIDPYVPGEQRPFEETVEGVRYKNVHNYEFFVMTEEGGTPAIVSFKSTSHKTGKKLFNLMYLQNPAQKKTPANNWINLGRKEETNDMGTFWIMDISVGKESTQEERTNCLQWISTIKQSDFKVAEEKQENTVAETRF